MESNFKLINIKKIKNKIEYDYEITGKWNDLLNMNERMFLEFDENIEQVPDSIAVIPLLCNILPICWVFNLNIYVDKLDKEFYNGLPEIKRGYANMYPKINMLGNLKFNEIEGNYYAATNTGTLFSGGVDAFNTLFKHIEEKPTLITIRGSDIKLNNIDGWKKVSEHHIKIAEKYGLKYCFIKTNFRTFINYSKLSKYVRRYIGGEWWHEFQHGIGILGNVAPIAYLNKYKTLYIASSLTKEEKGKVTCASDPSIDNYLKFASCKVVHDGYEYNRQDKIKNICEFIDKNNENSIDIRVCWISSGGNNCCNCEKCYRTMLGIITEKRNPNDFGFDLTVEKAQKMFKELPKHVKYMKQNYFCIQKRFNENYTLEETPKDLIWFRSIKMKYNKPFYIKAKDKSIHILKKVKNKILG